MTAWHARALVALFFLLLGSGQIYLSLRLPGGLGPSIAEPGPGLFPLLVGALMCAAAVINLLQTWIEKDRDQFDPARGFRDIAFLISTMAAYIVLLPRAGFAISAFLLLVATMSLFGMQGMWRRLTSAAVVTLVSYLVFKLLLGVNFPTPAWFG